MSTAQAVRTTTKEATKVQSVALMKNLIRASISEVCFCRNLFPSDCFKTTNFGNTTIRALFPKEADHEGKSTGRTINDDAATILKWQDSAFDALEKGYLRSIVLGIYSAEPDPDKRSLLESYVFSFRYPDNKEIEMTLEADKEVYEMSTVRDKAIIMIRTLMRLTETLKPVPEARYINLKLFYFDDLVPSDYQPEFFEDASNQEHRFFSQAPLKVNLGQVSTRHHSLTMKVAFLEELSSDLIEDPEAVNTSNTTDDTIRTGANDSPSAEKVSPSSESRLIDSSTKETLTDLFPVRFHEGVDMDTLNIARRLVLRAPAWTVKAFIDGMRGHNPTISTSGDGEITYIPLEISQQQARRLLKCLEEEGIVAKAGPAASFRYELTEDARRRLKHAAAVSVSTTTESKGVDQEANGNCTIPEAGDLGDAWFLLAVEALFCGNSQKKSWNVAELAKAIGVDSEVVHAMLGRLESSGAVELRKKRQIVIICPIKGPEADKLVQEAREAAGRTKSLLPTLKALVRKEKHKTAEIPEEEMSRWKEQCKEHNQRMTEHLNNALLANQVVKKRHDSKRK